MAIRFTTCADVWSKLGWDFENMLGAWLRLVFGDLRAPAQALSEQSLRTLKDILATRAAQNRAGWIEVSRFAARGVLQHLT